MLIDSWSDQEAIDVHHASPMMKQLAELRDKYDLHMTVERFVSEEKECFLQVAKVLKPGGVFMIVNESDGKDEASLKYEKIIDGMKCHTVEEIEDALKSAGFSRIRSDYHKSKPWITVIAKRSL